MNFSIFVAALLVAALSFTCISAQDTDGNDNGNSTENGDGNGNGNDMPVRRKSSLLSFYLFYML